MAALRLRHADEGGGAAEEPAPRRVGGARRAALERLPGAERDRRVEEVERLHVVGAGVVPHREALVPPAVRLPGGKMPRANHEWNTSCDRAPVDVVVAPAYSIPPGRR